MGHGITCHPNSRQGNTLSFAMFGALGVCAGCEDTWPVKVRKVQTGEASVGFGVEVRVRATDVTLSNARCSKIIFQNTSFLVTTSWLVVARPVNPGREVKLFKLQTT